MPVVSAVARIPGLPPAPLGPGGPGGPGVATVVEPGAGFEVQVGAPLREARLVLLDSQDLVVPASVDSEVSSAGSRFTLQPAEPLSPGGSYLLRLEGLTGRLVRSGADAAYEPISFPVRVSGSPPPRAPPKKASKKRRG